MQRAIDTTPRLGFEIRFRLNDGIAEGGALALWDDFTAGVSGRGLSCDDARDVAAPVRLLYRSGASATEDDRAAVREWARRRGEIAAYDVGPLAAIPSRLTSQSPSAS